MYTTKEAAERLGVSVRRVNALVNAGVLSAEKFGHSWMVDEASVEEYASAPRKAGRPLMDERNVENLARYTLMNREHPVLDFTYNRRTGATADLVSREGIDWKPLGIGLIEKEPNRSDLAAWIAARAIPDLRPHVSQVLRGMDLSGPADLMLSSFGLNLSDQYWFKPVDAAIEWGDINCFENGYESELGEALLGGRPFPAGAKTTHSPDAATGGALAKAWMRVDGVDCLVKGGTGGDNREPYNELLAGRLLSRLMQEEEYVTYSLFEWRGRTYSSCATMIDATTELIPAADVLRAFCVTEGRNQYRGYLGACAQLGVPGAERLVAKMIVADFIMMNFDRHTLNFGLVRNVESLDGYRIAPLFDNGCGFCARATLGELQHGRYLWESHPFIGYPTQQLALVDDYGWYDPGMLEGFLDEVPEVLALNPQMSEEFIEAVRGQVDKQIEVVNDMAREHGRG